jgi:hypothetical protein
MKQELSVDNIARREVWPQKVANSPPAEASTQGLKYKTNMLTILMHQICISTTQVSSVMLRSESWEAGKKCGYCKSRRMKTKQECHEIEPNLSKDRAMPEGDNLSFWDEFTKFTFFLTVQFIFVFESKYRST